MSAAPCTLKFNNLTLPVMETFLVGGQNIVLDVPAGPYIQVSATNATLKIGAGMSPEAFQRKSASGRMGHIGLAESAHMLADAIGADRERQLDRELRPVLAQREVDTGHVHVDPGQVAGVHEQIVLSTQGTERVRMELEMFVAAPSPRDAVIVEGSPRLEVEITSGVAGDEGTVAVVVSCVSSVGGLVPGLRTMLDVPLAPPTAPRGVLKATRGGE